MGTRYKTEARERALEFTKDTSLEPISRRSVCRPPYGYFWCGPGCLRNGNQMTLARFLNAEWWRFQWRYWRGRTPWDTQITPPEVMEFLSGTPPGKALDLGCGTGTNAITLARHGWQVTGVDFIPKVAGASLLPLPAPRDASEPLPPACFQGHTAHARPVAAKSRRRQTQANAGTGERR